MQQRRLGYRRGQSSLKATHQTMAELRLRSSLQGGGGRAGHRLTVNLKGLAVGLQTFRGGKEGIKEHRTMDKE